MFAQESIRQTAHISSRSPTSGSPIPRLYPLWLGGGKFAAGSSNSGCPGCLQFAAAPDGKTLVGAADDGALLLIDTATGAIRSRLRGHATQVGAMAISRDSKWLASATWDLFKDDNDAPHEKNLCLWNLHSGERVRTFELPDRLTSVLAFDDTGKRLFTAGGSQGFIKQRAACGLRRARGSGVA